MDLHGRGARWLTVAALGLGAAASLGAQSLSAVPPASDLKLAREYAKLEAKAPTQQGPKQAETLARLAEIEFAFAQDAYTATDQSASAEQFLARATQHADQACQLLQPEAALGKTDNMKNVEISLQKIGYGLRGLAQQVHFRQRPTLQAAANHFADLRDQLLQLMFAPKKKG